jgi:hypothetical protein
MELRCKGDDGGTPKLAAEVTSKTQDQSYPSYKY